MSKPNVRLTEDDNLAVAKAQRILEKRGLVRPTVADAVRAALNEFVLRSELRGK